MIRPKIAWPVLLIEVDTTGVDRHDQVIRVECALADQHPDGTLGVVARYSGFEQPSLPISPAAYAVHGLTEERLRGRTIHRVRLEALVSRAACIISRHPASPRASSTPWCLAAWPSAGTNIPRGSKASPATRSRRMRGWRCCWGR